MSLFDELGATDTPMAAALAAGVAQLSNQQTVTFQQYMKSVLPTDGYVFWVASGETQQFSGSLHVLTERRQDEDQTLAANTLVFTAVEEISQLNSVAPNSMWIGTWVVDGTALQVAFSSTGMNYQQALLFIRH